jgi:hypothetical protein
MWIEKLALPQTFFNFDFARQNFFKVYFLQKQPAKPSKLMSRGNQWYLWKTKTKERIFTKSTLSISVGLNFFEIVICFTCTLPMFGLIDLSHHGDDLVGDWENTHRWFSRWRDRSIWEKLVDCLCGGPDLGRGTIDSTRVKVCQHGTEVRENPKQNGTQREITFG